MKKTISLFVVLLAVLALAGCSLGTTKTNDASLGAYGSPSMSTYKTFVPASESELAAAKTDGTVNAGYVIAKASKDFDPARFATMGATVAGSFDLEGYTYYRLYKKDGAVKLLATLERTKGIAYAQHELLSAIPENESSSGAAARSASARDAANIASFFNDPETWGRFGHFETTKAIDAYKAYGVGTNTVYVADIDTGINRTHEDFTDGQGDQIVEYAKSAFSSSDGGATFTFVGDGQAFVDVPVAENWDDVDHGSHTAGTIAALGNNGKGVAGVCWKNVKLISYKCFSDHTSNGGSGSDWAIYGSLQDLVNYKIAQGITQTIPVNMSLGGSYAGPFELEMINYGLANNVVVIASMGNDGYNRAQYPAAYAGVIAVGATRANGEKVPFSVSGNFISVMAPGYDIYSTGNASDTSYMDMSGTSMAAPFVTGTVAYLLTFNPNLKPDQIKALLESTADNMGTAGWDEDTGYGQVNVKKAAGIVKAGTVPASGSVYTTKKIVVDVRNTNINFDSGLGGALKTAVIGQPVYLYNSTGTFIYAGLTNSTDGSMEFRMLKPGNYTVTSNYYGTKQSQSITIGTTADVPVTLSFNTPVLFIQTLINDGVAGGSTSGADSAITLYESDGTTVVAGPYDHGALDTLVVANLASGTYILKIAAYNDDYGTYGGEYGLNIGYAGEASVNTTNARGSLADDSLEENDDAASASAVSLSTDYGLYLGDEDWFSFVIP